MNFLAALLGGAAEGIGAYGKSAQDEERAVRLKQLDADLETKRQETIQAMRDKSDEAKATRARQANQADAATIKSAATDIGTKRDVGNIEKARGLISTDPAQREPISAQDVADIRGMVSPEFAKTQYGLIETSALQTAKDKETAAQGIGRPDLAKDYRATGTEEQKMQNDENRTNAVAAETARKTKADENRRVADIAKDDARNKALDIQAQRLEKVLSGNGSKNEVSETLKFIGEQRKEITTEASNLRNAMKDELSPDAVKFDLVVAQKIRDTYKPQLDALDSKRNQIDSDFSALRAKIGLPSTKTDTKPSPSPKPTTTTPLTQSAFDALPSGAIYVNPADGKTYRKK